jgi:ribosomal protein L32E
MSVYLYRYTEHYSYKQISVPARDLRRQKYEHLKQLAIDSWRETAGERQLARNSWQETADERQLARNS